jgi:hypothetical protein
MVTFDQVKVGALNYRSSSKSESLIHLFLWLGESNLAT